jgi:hypothetical protein
MNQLAALFAPLLLLFPGVTPVAGGQGDFGGQVGDPGRLVPAPEDAATAADSPEMQGWALLIDSIRPPVQEQVRIEQRMTIRISPRMSMMPQPDMMMDLPRQGMPRQMRERNFQRCLPITSIVGVQSGGSSRLVLFLRDRRMLSAELEKACRARDFYSGFYVDRNADGQLCVDRDRLHSRSGSDCSVSRLRELVPADD